MVMRPPAIAVIQRNRMPAAHEIDVRNRMQRPGHPASPFAYRRRATARREEKGNAMIDPPYADRLREALALKIRLRNVFTSPGLIEDNERQIRLAQQALRTAEEALSPR
jgi:hypothetical protein